MRWAYAMAIVAALAVLAGGMYAYVRSVPASGDTVVVQNEPYYTVRATYPKGAPAAVGEAAAQAIAQFKADSGVESLTPQDAAIQGLGPDRKYSIDISTQIYASAAARSYVLSIYEDTLGAHPNGFYRTLTFDRDGNQLSLADLFAPGSAYLERLSAAAYPLVVAQLAQKAGADPTPEMLDEARMGTEPSPEALQFFYLEDQNLHLLFPPYQVAAYAAGPFDIVIPLSQLSDILAQRFR